MSDEPNDSRGEPEPGELIAKVTCPCCGAALEVMHGDEPGQVGVLGTPTPNDSRGEDAQEYVNRLRDEWDDSRGGVEGARRVCIVPCSADDPKQDLCWESAHETPRNQGWKIDPVTLANLIAAERADAARPWQEQDDAIRAELRRLNPDDKARDIIGSIRQLHDAARQAREEVAKVAHAAVCGCCGNEHAPNDDRCFECGDYHVGVYVDPACLALRRAIVEGE